ncbi:MAG: Fic family protein [Planctomycetes bacterium]|nr:Fic family protein [Planctomycetota bacterium]
MKIPKKPPSFNKIWDSIGKDRFEYIYQHLPISPLVNGKYIHWDKLRHLAPPDYLTSNEWWFGLKLCRREAKAVPLCSANGRPFEYLLPDPIHEWLHEIDLGAGGRIAMSKEIINTEMKDQYYLNSLFEEAIASSQIEGAVTTRRAAKDMLREKRAPENRAEQMVLNNYNAMLRIKELEKEKLTPELIFEIHRIITEKTLDDTSAAGRFRKATVDGEELFVLDNQGKILHNPPPVEQLEERMAAMCAFANGETPDSFVHPVIRSIILHFWLAYDHPFEDGNGRIARALFYWSMLHYGFWLFEFVSISPTIYKASAQYYLAFLYVETDDNDLTYFINHQLKVIRTAMAELHEYIKRKTREVKEIESKMHGMTLLNHRQRALVSHALRHPYHKYIVASHRTSHGISYETARSDLLNLCERGLFSQSKSGRTWNFTRVGDFENKLANLQD